MSNHGTVTRYGQGCRCDSCKAARSAYRRDHYKRKTMRDVGSLGRVARDKGIVVASVDHQNFWEQVRETSMERDRRLRPDLTNGRTQ